MADYNRTKNDTAPFFYATLVDGDGVPANLTNATVRFIMRGIRATAPKVAWDAVIDHPTGDDQLVHYEPLEDDIDEEGGYFVDWEVTYSNGKVETFPNDHSMTCHIGPDLEEYLTT